MIFPKICMNKLLLDKKQMKEVTALVKIHSTIHNFHTMISQSGAYSKFVNPETEGKKRFQSPSAFALSYNYLRTGETCFQRC